MCLLTALCMASILGTSTVWWDLSFGVNSLCAWFVLFCLCVFQRRIGGWVNRGWAWFLEALPHTPSENLVITLVYSSFAARLFLTLLCGSANRQTSIYILACSYFCSSACFSSLPPRCQHLPQAQAAQATSLQPTQLNLQPPLVLTPSEPIHPCPTWVSAGRAAAQPPCHPPHSSALTGASSQVTPLLSETPCNSSAS